MNKKLKKVAGSKAKKKTTKTFSPVIGIIPLPVPGSNVVAYLENGALGAANNISPALTSLLLAQLIFALWLVTAKVRLKHRAIGAFVAMLVKNCPCLPTRSELDLWVRMLLQVLHKYNYIPTADFKFYRHDPSALHRVTRAQLEKIANDYKTLRALQNEFGKSKPKSVEEIILELLCAVRRRIEATPDAMSPAAQTEFLNIQQLVGSSRKHSPKNNSSKSVGKSAGAEAKAKPLKK